MASTDLKLCKSSLSVGAKIRDLFEGYMIDTLGKKPRDVALLLSGGIDSALAGIAATRTGHRVHAYTFRIEGQPGFDDKWAEHTASVMGWEWTLVELPSDVYAVAGLVPMMHDEFSCRLKRNYECIWPLLFSYARITEKYVVSGLAADNHYMPNRKAQKLGARENKKVFDELRSGSFARLHEGGIDALSVDYNPANLWMNLQAERHFGKVGVNPYLEKELYDLLLPFNWDQLHKPRQKHHLVGAYPEVMKYVGHRNHRNYQNAGGIDTLFEKLLKTPLNFKKSRRALDMYASWRHHPDEFAEARAVVKKKYAAKAEKLLRPRKRKN